MGLESTSLVHSILYIVRLFVEQLDCCFLSSVPLLTSKAMSYFKVSTLNLNRARDVRKRACLFETFKPKKNNIMML